MKFNDSALWIAFPPDRTINCDQTGTTQLRPVGSTVLPVGLPVLLFSQIFCQSLINGYWQQTHGNSDSLCRLIVRSDVLWDHRSNNLHRLLIVGCRRSFTNRYLPWVLVAPLGAISIIDTAYSSNAGNTFGVYRWPSPLLWGTADHHGVDGHDSLHSHYGNTRTEVDEDTGFNVRQVLAKILQLVKPRITC